MKEKFIKISTAVTTLKCKQEAGNKRATVTLKYVVLANMLALSDINPFAAREAKAYVMVVSSIHCISCGLTSWLALFHT